MHNANLRCAASARKAKETTLSPTPSCIGHSRERFEHGRQGLGDLINDEGNSKAITECRE